MNQQNSCHEKLPKNRQEMKKTFKIQFIIKYIKTQDAKNLSVIVSHSLLFPSQISMVKI